jgi:hypothetical protein
MRSTEKIQLKEQLCIAAEIKGRELWEDIPLYFVLRQKTVVWTTRDGTTRVVAFEQEPALL